MGYWDLSKETVRCREGKKQRGVSLTEAAEEVNKALRGLLGLLSFLSSNPTNPTDSINWKGTLRGRCFLFHYKEARKSGRIEEWSNEQMKGQERREIGGRDGARGI